MLPIFTIGRYFEQSGAVYLPFSLQIHHAVADGYHASQLVDTIQKYLYDPSAWLTDEHTHQPKEERMLADAHYD